jgi:AmmeMemoRadiSam system protein A
MNDQQKKRLLGIARDSIRVYLETGKRLDLTETDPELIKESGVFVTLHEHDRLRGCIGYIQGVKPLYQAVAEMALEAAVNDPRFQPIDKKELGDIDIEISVMSPLEKIDDPAGIEVGKHGILIKKGYNSGLLLPQVATQYGWGREQFLQQTCNKAGLGANEWKKGADIYIFSAEVFGEKG